MNKAILDSVKLLHIVDDDTACFGHEVLHESIRSCGDTDTDETFGTKGYERDVPVECSECASG